MLGRFAALTGEGPEWAREWRVSLVSDSAATVDRPDEGGRTLTGTSAAGRRSAEESGTQVMATVDRPSPFHRFFRRLTASEAELDAEELQRSTAASGCTPACDCRGGQLVSVSGRLRTVVYTPRTNLPTLEADLYDGSDVVTLVWLGRRHIAGIEPGRQLTVRGRIAVRDGRKVIYNPYYELELPK
jgi:hypothetical protein